MAEETKTEEPQQEEPKAEEPRLKCEECGEDDPDQLTAFGCEEAHAVCSECTFNAFLEKKDREAADERMQRDISAPYSADDLMAVAREHARKVKAMPLKVILTATLSEIPGIKNVTIQGRGPKESRQIVAVHILLDQVQTMAKQGISTDDAFRIIQGKVVEAMHYAKTFGHGRPPDGILGTLMDALGKKISEGSEPSDAAHAIALDMLSGALGGKEGDRLTLDKTSTGDLILGIHKAHEEFSCEECPVHKTICPGHGEEYWKREKAKDEEGKSGAETVPEGGDGEAGPVADRTAGDQHDPGAADGKREDTDGGELGGEAVPPEREQGPVVDTPD